MSVEDYLLKSPRSNLKSPTLKRSMETSKYLEILPLAEELEVYSHESHLSEALLQGLTQEVSIDDLLEDIAAWKVEFALRDVPLLSEGFDGFRFKSNLAVRLRHARGMLKGLPFLDCFKDVLTFRINLLNYPVSFPAHFEVVDMVNGVDANGYRGIHLYYQKNPRTYPIEIQIWSESDYNFNSWYHKYLTKYDNPEVGRQVRLQYDLGNIKTEEAYVAARNHHLLSGGGHSCFG